MKVKIFGDMTPIDWQALGVRMPFAPMHELAKKYKLNPTEHWLSDIDGNPPKIEWSTTDFNRTFETIKPAWHHMQNLFYRILVRTDNTITALDRATPDTICINLGGGYTHAQKYPNTGYAYSLINDHIWAVDYQLEQGKRIGIIDMDFHYPGGTVKHYKNNPNVNIVSTCNSLHGVLYNHLSDFPEGCYEFDFTKVDKVLLNIGTDIWEKDALFGKYNHYNADWILELWKNRVKEILEYKLPLAITCGGGYGSYGLELYTTLISWLQNYESN